MNLRDMEKLVAFQLIAFVIMDIALAALLFVYIPYIGIPGPELVLNTTLPAWLCGLLVFYSYQVIHAGQKSPRDVVRRFELQFGYFLVSLALWLILTICFIIGGRTNAWIWCIFGIIVSVLALFVLQEKKHLIDADNSSLINGEYQLGHNGLYFMRGKRPSDEEMERKCCACLTCWNITNSVLAVIFLALLISGAVVLAQGTLAYPPRGKFATIKLASGKEQKISYLCDGPKNDSFPVYLTEADGSHGQSDFWPLQVELVKRGRRVCVYDKPGLGWSDYWHPEQNLDANTFLPQLLEAMGEKLPMIFIGWGGGADVVWQYGLKHPANVHSFVFLDAYPNEIEWLVTAKEQKMDNAKINEYKQQQLAGRETLFAGIRGMAVPWGLMSIFLGPPSDYKLPSRVDEHRWFYLTEKTWTTQFFFLLKGKESKVDTASPLSPGFNTKTGLENKLVVALNSNRTKTVFCESRKATGEQCDKAFATEENYKSFQKQLSQVTGNSIIIPCVEKDCDLAMTYKKPAWIADELMKVWPK